MVRVWDANNAKELFILKGQTAPAFSLDGKRLVSCGSDRTVNVWNAQD
jgi:WD40 repeat protein